MNKTTIEKILRKSIAEETNDFLEENGEFSDFQKGVLFGLKLALVKIQKMNESDF